MRAQEDSPKTFTGEDSFVPRPVRPEFEVLRSMEEGPKRGQAKAKGEENDDDNSVDAVQVLQGSSQGMFLHVTITFLMGKLLATFVRSHHVT